MNFPSVAALRNCFLSERMEKNLLQFTNLEQFYTKGKSGKSEIKSLSKSAYLPLRIF